ncbi:MAG: hypothetical protein LBK82_11140 [Planctomycetaceae bacterium]|nr:hypothetical protein [Planctomycetaceae bacterium]
MKRMFMFPIVLSFLLVGYFAVAAAPEANIPNGKSFYSNRSNRVLRTLPEKTPAPPSTEPLLAPTITSELDESNELLESKTPSNKTLPNKSPLVFPDFSSTVPVLDSPNQADKSNQSALSVVEKPTERPLSKIDISPPIPAAKTERTEVYKKTDTSSGSNFISRTTFPNQPVSTEDRENKQENQLDELNARLAKIQLEKHNLNETLKLIDKIKSSAVKARTLVDLAEYVSRDNNYKKEAEQLFALAVDGIDALTKGEAIVIKIKSDLKTESALSSPVTDTTTSGTAVFTKPNKPTDSATIPPRKPAITLLEEDKPVSLSNPQTESTPKTAPKLDESLSETLPTVKTPDVPVTSSVAPKPVAPVLNPAAKKTPILLEDEPEKKQTLEDKINIIEKETVSPPTPPKRPMILLDDDSEISKEEKPAEMKTPPTRRPSLLLREEPDTNKENEKNITESTIKSEPLAKEEPETMKPEIKSDAKPDVPTTSPKSQRRSMPGRKVTLEEN